MYNKKFHKTESPKWIILEIGNLYCNYNNGWRNQPDNLYAFGMESEDSFNLSITIISKRFRLNI